MKLIVGKHCGACRALESWMNENDITLEKIIAEDNMDEVTALGVKTLPTLVLDDGNIVKGNENIKEILKPEGEE